MRRLLPAAFLFLVPCALDAQTASYTYINQKAPYTNWTPLGLTALNLPKIGTTFTVRTPCSYSNYGNTVQCILLTGIKNPNLRLDALGGYLYSSAEMVMATPFCGPRSNWVARFPIPNSSQLLGVQFYQQVLWVDSWRIGVTYRYLSRGGHGVIGK